MQHVLVICNIEPGTEITAGFELTQFQPKEQNHRTIVCGIAVYKVAYLDVSNSL